MVKTKKRVKRVDPGIERARAIVRPISVMYSMFILSILAIMAMAGYSMPVEGVGANCVNALIGITGFNSAEYSLERGVLHFLKLRRSKNEQPE